MQELILDGCIEAVENEPHCCNPLTVAGPGEKLRLVLDLRHVNKYVRLNKFRHEDLRTLAEMFEEGDFFLNSASHTYIQESRTTFSREMARRR